MKRILRAALPIAAAALLLSACSANKEEPPQSYTLGDNSLPSLTALVSLDDVQFKTTDGENDTVTYVYSKLSSGGETAQAYAQALETDYSCTLAADAETSGAPDFSSESGQVLAGEKLEDSTQIFLLTIQWEETSCSVTPSLAEEDALPQEEPQSLTLQEAIDYVTSLSPSYLGLQGSSMEQYTVLPQDGTVLLDNQPCLLLNIYQTSDHQLQGSYLLQVSTMQVYHLDRSTGEVTPVG